MIVAIDIGMVCVNLRLEERNRKLGFSDGVPAAAQKLYDDIGTGAISVETFVREMSAMTGLSDTAVIEAWNYAIGSPIDGMTEAVREFASRGVEFVFLSDTNNLHMAEVRRVLPFANLVKDSILSQEIGVCKPSPEIYRAFEEKHGKPDLYFDDLIHNIESAASLGWNAVLFTGVQIFRDAVEACLSAKNR